MTLFVLQMAQYSRLAIANDDDDDENCDDDGADEHLKRKSKILSMLCKNSLSIDRMHSEDDHMA